MYKFFITLICFFHVTTLFAQQITNIRVTQKVDNVIILYDLTGGQTGETFNIEVTVSDNSRQSFLITPKSLSGDLKDVTSGNNKKIIWDVLNDREELTGEGFVFKLNAKSNKPINNFSANSGTFTDERDGEVYKWVKIDEQIWMAESLKATKYSDGTAIPEISNNAYWAKMTTGAYCWYENNINNKTTYGALYNWFAVITRKLCPQGWHVPTDDDWENLEISLGGNNVAGGKLKEVSTKHWKSPNTGATNLVNFTALPGGGRNFNGEFNFLSQIGYFWSLSQNNLRAVRSINYNSTSLYKDNTDNDKMGFSVRCIKN